MWLATVAILGIVPLEKMFDFLGEQMALYCGQSIGDLIVITLNKCVLHFTFVVAGPLFTRFLVLLSAVEVTLAIILLTKCRLRLLQATLIGASVHETFSSPRA